MTSSASSRSYTVKAYKAFTGFRNGRLSLFDPAKNLIRQGHVRVCEGAHLGAIGYHIDVLRGEMELTPEDFYREPKFASGFEGRGITTYRVTRYVPGTVYRVVSDDGGNKRNQIESVHLVVGQEDTIEGAALPRKDWPNQGVGKPYALWVTAGVATAPEFFYGEPYGPGLGPVILTGLQIDPTPWPKPTASISVE
jgi:hypothetical protein